MSRAKLWIHLDGQPLLQHFQRMMELLESLWVFTKKENVVLTEIKPQATMFWEQTARNGLFAEHAAMLGVCKHPPVQVCPWQGLRRKNLSIHMHISIYHCAASWALAELQTTHTSCSFHHFIPRYKEKSVFLHDGTNKVNHWEYKA